jgi:hypothetical protein
MLVATDKLFAIMLEKAIEEESWDDVKEIARMLYDKHEKIGGK